MRFRSYKVLSLIFFILGLLFLMNSDSGLLGVSIGISNLTSVINNILGSSLVLISLVIFMVSEGGLEGRLEDEGGRIVDAKTFNNRLKKYNPEVIILDSSILLAYSHKEIETILKEETGKTIIPNAVFREIRDPYLRWVIGRYCQKLEPPEMYKKIAGDYLRKGTKPQHYNKLMKIMEGEMEPTRKGIEELKKEIIKLISRFEKEHNRVPNKEETAREFERHYKVSAADIDVLASALYEARHRKRTVVGEKDLDLKEALEKIRRRGKKIGGYIKDIDPYYK
ncbi:hypothetical protein HYT58_02850 [Candidatus Woesearchaeota archaeon]|nr:hypothetical protein [Candidatus Woesearchaeota archaeon]